MNQKIYKSFSVVSKAVDADAGIYEAMITTESTDRSGDIVRATGGQLENYLKNPVVLWAHDYSSPPIAKTLSIQIMPGTGIKAAFQFPDWGINPQADIVRQLWAGGFINATSIGFMPLTSAPIDPKYTWGPQDYTSWELLEFSIVPVPANQDALRLAVKTITETVKKTGRVLSAKNETKLKDAVTALNEILAQLGDDDEKQQPEGTQTSDTEYPATEGSNTDLTLHDENPELLEKLSNYFEVLKGLLK